MTRGEQRSSIRVLVEMSAGGSGKSTIMSPDGPVPGPTKQRFCRVDRTVEPGDWLLNLRSKESHQIVSMCDEHLVITTEAEVLPVPWDVAEAVLLVVR